MPRSVRWKGQNIWRPGSYTWHDLSGLANLNLGVEQSIIIVGECTAGEPQANAASPVYHAFTDPQDAITALIDGNLAECVRFAFEPALDGQTESEVPIGGVTKLYVIKTNQSTQASYTVNDGAAHDCVTFRDRIWGVKGNQTWFKIETSGTGLVLTFGRDVDPYIGEQESEILFGITGTDEWLGVSYLGSGASATMSYDGTTFSTTTAVGGGENISILTANLTMSELVDQINAWGGGALYTASVLRADREQTPADYLDIMSGVDIKDPVIGKDMGVAWDIVEWCNNNCVYVEADWVAGYQPQTYTQTWLSGGTLGVSTTDTIQDAFKTAKKIPSRFIVSAFNADVGAGGAISVDTINGYLATHLNQCNPIGGRSERQGFCCTESTTKADLWTELSSLNNEWLSAVNTELYREGPDATKKWMGCHTFATAVAAMMAGSPIATPMTHKYINCRDMRYVATDFDPSDNDDFAAGINAGLLMLETDISDIGMVGFRIAKGITTYKTEDNDMRILLEGVEGRLYTCILLRRKFEKPQTGHKSRGAVTANDLQGQAIEVFRILADQTSPDFVLIPGTDEDGNEVPPFRNVRAILYGDQVYIRADLTYTTGINFIFNELRATYPSALATS